MLNSVTDKQLNVYCTVEANGSVNSVVKPEETVYLPPLPLSKEGENLLTKAEAAEKYLPKPKEEYSSYRNVVMKLYQKNRDTGETDTLTVLMNGTFGFTYVQATGGANLALRKADDKDIDEQWNSYYPICVNKLSRAVKVGVTKNFDDLTDEQKYLATTWLGAVKHADTPTGYSAVYAIDRQGNDLTVSYSPQVSSWALAQRVGGGALFVGEPTDDKHATTKSYVDNLPDKITDEAIKAKWVAWLGTAEGEDLLTKTEADEIYVKFTDYATNSTPGTVIIGGPTFGLYITEYGLLTVHHAFLTDIDEKKEGYRPITPNGLDHAVKVGVTTNTEVLTDEEKAAAQTWLGIEKTYCHLITLTCQNGYARLTVYNKSAVQFTRDTLKEYLAQVGAHSSNHWSGVVQSGVIYPASGCLSTTDGYYVVFGVHWDSNDSNNSAIRITGGKQDALYGEMATAIEDVVTEI